MKFYRPLFIALVDCLEQTINHSKVSTRVLEMTFQKNKKWGSKDRKNFAESFYAIVKWQLLIKKILESKNTELAQSWNTIAVYYLTSQGFVCEYSSEMDEVTTSLVEEAILIGKEQPLNINNLSELKGFKELSLDQLYSFPKELHVRLEQEGISLKSFYEESQAQAPLFVRANTHVNTVAELKKYLEEENILSEFVELAPYGLRIDKKSNVFRTKAFKEGRFEVQDGGSQQISVFSQPKAGDFIIDACAGGGGKSLHLSNLVDNKGRVLAMDIHGWKLEELRKRARRNLCHNIEARLIDGTKTIKRLKDKADLLLLDVPCSGSGVYRRNPDAKYKWTEQSSYEILELQKTIFLGYSSMVKSGGRLVYSTCSVLPSENRKQVENFLSANSNWKLQSEKTIAVGENKFDGYYMALLSKN